MEQRRRSNNARVISHQRKLIRTSLALPSSSFFSLDWIKVLNISQEKCHDKEANASNGMLISIIRAMHKLIIIV